MFVVGIFIGLCIGVPMGIVIASDDDEDNGDEIT